MTMMSRNLYLIVFLQLLGVGGLVRCKMAAARSLSESSENGGDVSEPVSYGSARTRRSVTAEDDGSAAAATGEDDVDEQPSVRYQRAVSMLRMGKRPVGTLRMLRSQCERAFAGVDKKAVSMLRMGRGGSSDNEDNKRAVSMLRMGRSFDRNELGAADEYDDVDDVEGVGKRAVSMLRMGRSSSDVDRDGEDKFEGVDKKAVSMLRMGRGYNALERDDVTKRAVSMLRMGRSSASSGGDSNINKDKKAVSMLRMGRSQGETEEKRAVSMLRMGKRSDTAAAAEEEEGASTDEAEKRPVSMLRMGRSGAEDDKRAVSMLRMG